MHRDLVSRLGFGDNITEPMADNDTIIKWFDERGREADEWRESQRWRDDCHFAGHPDDEDCWECDPSLRLLRAEQRLAAVEALIETAELRSRSSLSRTFDGGTFGAWVYADHLRAALTAAPDSEDRQAGRALRGPGSGSAGLGGSE